MGCGVQKTGQESEQRASELSALQLQHSSLRNTYEAALKELDVLHSSHTSAAKRAEEALAELELVRETQQALTTQVRRHIQVLCLHYGWEFSPVSLVEICPQIGFAYFEAACTEPRSCAEI